MLCYTPHFLIFSLAVGYRTGRKLRMQAHEFCSLYKQWLGLDSPSLLQGLMLTIVVSQTHPTKTEVETSVQSGRKQTARLSVSDPLTSFEVLLII